MELPIPPAINLRKQSQFGAIDNQVSQTQNFIQMPPLLEHVKPQKRNFNLKVGDIIYFKSYLSDEFKGVISGDGIASNKLECIQILSKNKQIDVISNKSLQQKVGSLTFQKSLFQIVTGRKYQYQNQFKKDKQLFESCNQPIRGSDDIDEQRISDYQSKLKEEENKVREEISENDRMYEHLYGSNLVYGQEIQLVHLYSDCILSLNSNILAKENCCRELSLEEKHNENSNFRLLSMNQVKNPGEPILYGDQILIQSSQQIKWFVGIQKPSRKNLECDGLEVNASEQAQALKISNYIDNKTEEEIKSQGLRGKFLQSGDVVTLKNRYLGGYLCVKREQRITDGLEGNPLLVKDYETNIFKKMNQLYFDVSKIRSQDKIAQMFKLTVISEKNKKPDEYLNCLWQIQHVQSLTFNRPTYESTFLIRHVCSGLFLFVSGTNVGLTYDGLKPESYFYLKSKKTSNDSISYNEACKIQSFSGMNQDIYNSQDQHVVLVCLDDRVSAQRKSQKQNIERTLFLLKQAPYDISKTAFRLNSLQEYLIQFYIFLQDWGIIKTVENKRQYEYFEAFNNQKLLFDEILQLFQTLDNLKMYLTNDGKAQSNELQQQKQSALMDNDIINLLFAILRLSNFMIHHGNSMEANKSLQDKSPQKIAKQKLDPVINSSNKINCIQEIYNILALCVQSNVETSNYVLTLKMNEESILDFLLQQLKHQRKHVSNLIKESVRYTDMSNPRDSIKKWVDQLQTITEENVEDQTLYVEILSLMMIDPYEKPNPTCQNSCRRLLFRQQKDQHSPFQKSLFELNILEEKQEIYPNVIFYPKREKNQIQVLTYQFGQNNPTFCSLYNKFIEKQIKQQSRFTTSRPPIFQVAIDFFTTETLKANQLVKQEDMKNILPIFVKYENYLMNVLELYSALCKGRNQKSINCLHKYCFLHSKFLQECLKRQRQIKTELRFEKTLMDLFCNLYMDIDPLIKVSAFDNKCYLSDDLENFDIQKQSGFYFYENNASKSLKKSDEYRDFLNQKIAKAEHQQLRLYAIQMIDREQVNEVRLNYLEMFTQTEYPEHFKVSEFNFNIFSTVKTGVQQQKIDYQRLADYQLQYFLGLLSIVRNSIDLGYNRRDENKKIFSVLPNIFVALILLQQPEKKISRFNENENFETNLKQLMSVVDKDSWVKTFLPTSEQFKQQMERKNTQRNKQGQKQKQFDPKQGKSQFQKNWMLYFLIWTSYYNTNELLSMKIYLEALQILKILDFLQLNLQILHFLFNQQIQGESNSSSPSSRDIDEFQFQDEILSNNEKVVKKQKTPGVKAIKTVFKEPNGNKFTALLFTCLQSSEKRNKLNQELLKVLIEKFHQPLNSIKEIKEVEIIDNKMELKYFSIINGNSNSPEIISPKEATLLARRAIKFIQLSTKKIKEKRRLNSFDQIKDYLIKILEQFELFFKQNSQDSQYLRSFQNIVRNAGVHLVFLQFLIDPKKIRNSIEIVQFYKNLMIFFKYFTLDNETNTAILADKQFYLLKILDIIQIQQQGAESQFYVPIKITKLALQIIASLPQNLHDNIILKIFERIQTIGEDLFRSQEFFSQAYTLKDNNYEEIKIEKRSADDDAVAIFCLIQYLKILKALTKSFDKPAFQLPVNKHLILSQILKNSFLRVVLEPVNYYQQLLVPDQENKNEEIEIGSLHYHRIKLHSQLIIVITECCQYYRLGIQEMQRILLYEQLKTILLQQSSEYIVKRAYLQCLFELYINKVKEGEYSNDTVESDEVRDILSRIIIPELDQKQICKYLEGLAKLQENDGIKKVQKELRENIVKQKKNYFEKRQTDDNTVEKDVGILRDSSEFWSYIRKEGLIHFLVYTYDEMKDRTDIENPEGNNLSDEFAIIKQNVQRIKEIFNILERDFRVKKEDLDLDEYRELIVSIEEIIPQRKITKFGQNFRIGFMAEKAQGKLIFDKYDTLKEDQNGEKKLQEQDNVQRIENPFRRNFKIYLIRAKVNIVQFCQYIDTNTNDRDQRSKKILKVCNMYKTYITRKDIDEIYDVNVEEIIRQEKVNNKDKSLDVWEVFQQAMKDLFERKKITLLNQGQQVQIYKRQQDELDQLKDEFGKAAGILIKKQYDNAAGDEKKIDMDQILSSDVQIELLIYSLEKLENNLLDIEKLGEFLQKCQEIFLNNEVYLIKMCRVFLKLKRPTQDELDKLQEATEDDDDKIKKIIKKKEDYQEFQNIIADCGLDILALEILNNTDDDQQKIEALSFLTHLLDYGNEKVQKKFYDILKHDQQIKQKFLVFTRGFFLINLDSRLKELEQAEGNDTEYTILCLKVLEILQALCENVNVDFQKFLSCQYDDDSYQANINIVNEVAGLLADLLEKGQKVHDKLQKIFRQALESLVEFSTGYEENKKELCKNSRLFTLLNSILQKEQLKSFEQLQKENKNILKVIELKRIQQGEQIVQDEELTPEQQQEIHRFSIYQTLQSFIKLLLLLTQGRADVKILEFILEYVNIEQLINIAKQIYYDRIKPKQRNIVLDNICDETGNHSECSNFVCHFGMRTDEDSLLIQTGFNIFIICLKLAEHFPNEPQLSLFKFEEEQEEQDDLFSLDDFGEEIEQAKEVQKDLRKRFSNQKILPINPENKYELGQENDELILKENQEEQPNLRQLYSEVENDENLVFKRNDRFFKFYRQYTGRIEIQNQQNQIEKVFFQKPFLCNFITPNVKQHLIFEINRETDEDRMQGLIEYSTFYRDQMVHYQRINNRMIMHFGAEYWRLLKDISFILCLTIVVLLIFMHDTVIRSKLGSDKQDAPEDNNITAGEYFVSYLNNIITIVQLVLNLIIVFFCAIERYPISITYNRGQTNAKKVQILKKEAGFQIFWLTMKYYSIVGFFESQFSEEQVKQNNLKKLILVIFFDFDNFYNICIFGLTVYAFFNPYIYAVLLLDIIKRSEDLQNIIKSITSNGRNLIIFAFLGAIGLLIYAIIAFSNFDQMFDREGGVYGYTFILAVTSTINLGLRNGGGLGDALTQYPDPYEDPSLFWGRYFFDFTFFIIFNILFIQIIFGIILDTFGELRDERQALVKEIEGKCFVCSLDKNDIDTKGKNGWHYHIYLEHSVYHMLYYIIYIQNKDLNDCNALEKFVKKCIETKDTRFFPLKRALQIDEEEGQEE